jgi:hypothetical protein
MKKIKSYEMIDINSNAQNVQEQQLAEIIKSINASLESMHQSRRISNDHLLKMRVQEFNVKLPYLYFLPELGQVYHFFSFSLFTTTSDTFRTVLSHFNQ